MDWRFARFGDLTPREVHDLLQARSAVFVVEQNCVFPDIDGLDPQCWHLLGYARAPSRALAAYCRIVPPGAKYAEPSIGRVITTREARGTGAGKAVVREAIARVETLWPGTAIRIGAQCYLERFYGGFGFVTSSPPYDEDGIAHIEMLRPAAGKAEGSHATPG